ncbi:MAG TPA: prolyl oligopeptidase family serine peptidase [Elusimicrobiota bacterium]|nr:prolyl oligopeptidase family serine peptidase [Elusimicrobiota bacterium]
MKTLRRFVFALAALIFPAAAFAAAAPKVSAPADPYLWLEPLRSPKALAWAKAQNEKTLAVLAKDPRYQSLKSDIGRILKSKARLPQPALRGDWVYNFWQDGAHVHGLWRRVSLAGYSKPNPPWQTVLDLDALSKKEKQNWFWQGADCLPPENHRCLLSLSRGGTDASVVREFDVATKSFVPGGFDVPQAKSDVDWLDQNHLLVATDFGPGSLTASGYPREVKIWTRGTPLSQARLIFTGKTSDVEDTPQTFFWPGGQASIVTQGLTFFTSREFLLGQDGKLTRIPLPPGAEVEGVFHGQILALLQKDWKAGGRVFASGALISLPLDKIAAPDFGKFVRLVYLPDRASAFSDLSVAKDALYIDALHDVSGRVLAMRLGPKGWTSSRVPLPDDGSASVAASDPFQDRALISYESFLVPPTLYEVDGAAGQTPRAIKKQPAIFDAAPLTVDQHWAKSADGTMIPYFLVHPKGMKHDGKNPTLLYAYGGFGLPMVPAYMPYYSPVIGPEWLAKGGVFVMANIRGGGEFGPRWHEAALKTRRQKAYDDFIAVAERLIKTGVTSPRRLGIMGRSNGGLLVGVAFTERPDLFHAVICEVPLLDMMRYTHIGAGASWEAEYGNPADPKMAAAILRYSPYQNVRPGVHYPKVFFVTSSDDDRVEPGHARKMAAKMEAMGDPLYFYESPEGGHERGEASLNGTTKTMALEYTYLYRRLMDGGSAASAAGAH